jgi:hypothetical protein
VGSAYDNALAASFIATLLRVTERWSRLSVSELERQRLKLLRRELGIDPPLDEKREARR